MFGCESWTIKKAEHRRVDAFELWCWRRLSRVPWTANEIKPVNPKGNQPWIFTGKTDAEVEALILCPPDAKSWLTGKKPWCWEILWAGGEGTTEDEMVEWHHQLNGHEFKQAPGDGEGQESLACCMQSTGSQRVKHDWATEQQQILYLTLFSKILAMYLQLFWVSNRCDHL